MVYNQDSRPPLDPTYELTFIFGKQPLTDGWSGLEAARMVYDQGSRPPRDPTYELTTAGLRHWPDEEWAHHLIILMLDNVTVPDVQPG